MVEELKRLNHVDLNSHRLLVMLHCKTYDFVDSHSDFFCFHVLFAFSDMVCWACDTAVCGFRMQDGWNVKNIYFMKISLSAVIGQIRWL